MTLGPRFLLAVVGLLAVGVLSMVAYDYWRCHRVEETLVKLPADDIPARPRLAAFARTRGESQYMTSCAGCHGEHLQGDAARGVPDLQDGTWLYGQGLVSEIESTIQYGIRSGHPRSRNLTDMPAYLRTGQLTPAEIDDVVEYVLKLSDQPHDATAAQRGLGVYADKAHCWDCHGPDGLGNTDYGAPALTGAAWVYGGTREALRHSVAEGRHGLCPAWIDQLSPAAIRELAVYLHSVSSREARATPAT